MAKAQIWWPPFVCGANQIVSNIGKKLAGYLLQNLGKVDRTADEIFDEHLTNFNRQHTCATRLQKEFSNYIRCVRAVQNASKSLMEAITEVYESQWTGSEVLYGQAKTIDTQYQQFSYKLADQVLKQLDTYALQFPEMKSLQANAAKRKDDLKVTRGREQLEEAKSTYEVLNSELHDELPALYDSRILFLVTNLQTLFACEQQFHSETSKVYAELEAIVDKLATESQRGSYTLKKINANSNPSSPQQSPVKANLSIVNNVTNGSANANGHTSAQSVLPSPRTPSPNHQLDRQADGPEDEDDEPSYQNTEMVKAAAAASAATKAPTTNGTTASDSTAKHGELELNGSAPKENGQPAATAVTESVPATTNAAGSVRMDKVTQTPPLLPAQPNAGMAATLATSKTTSIATQMSTTMLSRPEATATARSFSPARCTAAGYNVSSSGSLYGNAQQPSYSPFPYTTANRAATTDLPPGVLYRVKATYKYVREDVDELSFEVGDVINVVEYEDPEDQEEGWLMGNKEGTNEKGMFPANFTRPL
uniref:Uncharacterized protein n=1 Tax=Anopheles merus TaxID=30066 RepID=A0A182VFW5_ANOME